ncbi:hypothetical protein R0131_00405 [Clostridium sp. AL.422]|uniref:hypothetical protein n=1 Tax=Clostridium TaxID=1485 RepID=UPI00293DA4CF|nr:MULTISPECIES: hypothetical protein [unclassified Clostridium]MDV4149289.1 hypothetical protein [Clostridium sp. AL.422]
MRNKDKVLLGLTCFLGGVIAGFLIAPIKKGLYFGNNCGNHVRSIEELKEVIDNSMEENESMK